LKTALHKNRLKDLQAALKKEKLDACLIEHPLELFYFTGLKLSAGRLLVHPKECLLLIDGRYYQAAQTISFVKTFLDGHEKLVEFCQLKKVKRLEIGRAHV
jgi:Xaa-Pro aminopeptidase